MLGFRRDLLTAAAYGVEEFLFVYGDRPTAGKRVEQLSVKDMIREVRTFETGKEFRIGVTSGLRPLPGWKQEADFCFVQIGFDLDALRALAGHRAVRRQGLRRCDRAREPVDGPQAGERTP